MPERQPVEVTGVGQELLNLGRSGPGHADANDGGFNPLVGYLRVCGEIPLHPQTVAQDAQQHRLPVGDTDVMEPGVFLQRRAQDLEWLDGVRIDPVDSSDLA